MTLNETAPAAKAAGPSDSSHYYGWNKAAGWHALYSDEKKYGLRDARKDQAAGLVAVPSVTTILGEVKKRQVDIWVQAQAAGAMYDLYRERDGEAIEFNETKENMIATALARADTASSPAKKLGSQIHSAIELAVAGKDYDASMDIYVQAVLKERAAIGLLSVAQEKCVGSLEHGYAGKVDDICEGLIIADYKSRGEAKAYDQDWLQLSAYGFAEFGPRFFEDGAGVVFPISTKNPGEVRSFIKRGRDLRVAFDGFLGLTAYWRAAHGYDPRIPTGTHNNAQEVA